MGNNLIQVGWREWVALPDLGIDAIKAKVDSGARTSCIHAFFVEDFKKNGDDWVRFGVHPKQKNTEHELMCEAQVIDRRLVSDSGGHRELRPVISTTLSIGNMNFECKFTLTNRDSMKFRMLLGRTAMSGRMVIDTAKSYEQGTIDTTRGDK
ncbi:MAG: ATP-dependent zinc protease [Ghiorsea sp.]